MNFISRVYRRCNTVLQDRIQLRNGLVVPLHDITMENQVQGTCEFMQPIYVGLAATVPCTYVEEISHTALEREGEGK